MKKTFLLLTLCFLVTSVFASDSMVVVFDNYLGIFHQRDCLLARRCTLNCIEVPLSEALKQGGMPCHICRPSTGVD